MTDFKKMNEELEEIVDKHMKKRCKPSESVIEVVINCATHFGGTEKALAMCLIALGNCIKHIHQEHCVTETISDSVIKMMLPFTNEIMTCKRFE